MEGMNARPSPDTREQVDSLLDVLPFGDRIPRRSEDLAFDQAWEIRAFSMTVALHRELGFPWAEFQQQLVEAIRSWEAAHDDLSRWSYYERWMAALEELASRKGWVTQAELDSRSRDVLAQPANQHHQHAVREPVAVVASA